MKKRLDISSGMSDICSTKTKRREQLMQIKTISADRKEIVKAMELILGMKAKYQGPPTFAYVIGSFTVDRNGSVETDAEEEGNSMKQELTARGLAEADETTLKVELPMTGMTADAIRNLLYMIHSKQYLLKKSIGADTIKVPEKLVERLQGEEASDIEAVLRIIGEEQPLGIAFSEERISFTGFPFDAQRVKAYTELAALMVKGAKEAKRVNPKETVEENEKYYMRIWLVRLGLDGKDAKETRRVLLENLKGHTAFRTEADKEKWMEKNSRKKENEAQ